jgi:hypothetical protein
MASNCPDCRKAHTGQCQWHAGYAAGLAAADAPAVTETADLLDDYDPRLHAGHEGYERRGLCEHPDHAAPAVTETDHIAAKAALLRGETQRNGGTADPVGGNREDNAAEGKGES